MNTMETAYEKFDDNDRRKSNRLWITLLIITCVLLVAVIIIAIVFAIDNSNNSSGSSADSSGLSTTVSPTEYCTTTSCLELAADLANTINASVDPCEDFYHYVCDGWDDENSWVNIRISQFGTFNDVAINEMETFLDELFYNTNPSLTNHSAVQKATAYYKTCYHSTDDDETAAKIDFLTKLVTITTFTDNTMTWSDNQQDGFHNVLVNLTQINFNAFFSLQSAGTKRPVIVQFADFWQSIGTMNLTNTMDTTFVPLYQSLFGLDPNTAHLVGNAVVNFMMELYDITTVNDIGYPPSYLLTEYWQQAPFGSLSSLFNDSAMLNYTRLVYDAYGVSPMDMKQEYFQYLAEDLSFFQQLGSIIESEGPLVVQYFIWTSILYYYLDYKNTMSQDRYTDRTQFCFEKTINEFPFVYGYILFNKLYSDEAHTIASTLARTVKNDGTRVLIENATWLDEESKANALKKADDMKLYIGFPPRIKSGDNIDIFYKAAMQSFDVSWSENVESLTIFQYQLFNDTFWGKGYNLTATWPEIFNSPQSYDGWLTGINAFYFPLSNWFTIPVSISQPPFLEHDPEYPSSLTYGGLGVVTGHEMSHGFDPDGSQYNYNGTNVGSIFSNYSQQQYQSKMQCFINQYSNITVDYQNNGIPILDNGTRTITENIADNAGIYSSYLAWTKYIDKNGNDQSLYGIDLNQKQLFFIGYARLWCSTDRVGSYANYTDVHSANYARVIGPLQNHPAFSDAFNCPSGTRMNPKNKCIVW